MANWHFYSSCTKIENGTEEHEQRKSRIYTTRISGRTLLMMNVKVTHQQTIQSSVQNLNIKVTIIMPPSVPVENCTA